MKTYQKTLISILIGLIAFPAVTLGGSFVVSLIQGKTPAEAVQILAEQVDILIGRVEVVETKQDIQEQTTLELQNIIDQQKELVEQLQLEQQGTQTQIEKNEWCNKMETLSKRVVAGREISIQEAVDYYGQYPPTAEGVLEKTQTQYQSYLEAKEKCDLLSQ